MANPISITQIVGALEQFESRVLGPLSPDSVDCSKDAYISVCHASLQQSWKRFIPLLICYTIFAFELGRGWDCYIHFRWLLHLQFCPLIYITAVPVFFVFIAQYWAAFRKNVGPGRGWPDEPTPPEPAYRNYFFYKAWKDYQCLFRELKRRNAGTTKHVGSIVVRLVANPTMPVTWLPGVFLASFLIMGFAAAFVVYAALGALLLAVELACCAAIILSAYALRLLASIFMQVRRIVMVCPNKGCYRHIALPIYLCPNCQSRHMRLIPGEYGVFRRKCKCKERIGTTFLSGRTKLQCLCPHEGCHKLLPRGIDTIRTVHISFVGGPNAGKTTLLLSVVDGLVRRAEEGKFAICLPRPSQQSFLKACESLFLHGHFPAKTVEVSPDAVVAYLESHSRARVALYLYDPAGEAYERRDILRNQRFHTLAVGVLFVVDPMRVQRIAIDRIAGIIEPHLSTNGADPQEVYDRFVANLAEATCDRDQLRNISMGIVLSKADKVSDSLSDARKWLTENGQGNLVRSVENDFIDVRYVCSSFSTDSRIDNVVDWVLGLTALGDFQNKAKLSAPPDHLTSLS